MGVYIIHNSNRKDITAFVVCHPLSITMVPAPLPVKKALAPSTWQKEIQRTVAAAALLDKISGGPTMTIKNLQAKIFTLYHGNPAVQGSTGYLESLLRGRGQFEDLWSREELNTSLQGNAESFFPFDLVLKNCYSSDYQNRYVVGSQFTTRSLAGTGMKNIST